MNPELTLRDYLDILRRRAWIIGTVFGIAVVAAFAWSAMQTPQYQSSVRIQINLAAGTEILNPGTGTTTNTSFADRQAATAVQVIESRLVDEEAEQILGFKAKINARAEARSDIVELTATNTDAAVAQQIANAYADAYLGLRTSDFAQKRIAGAEGLQLQIAEIEAGLDALTGTDLIRQELLRDDLVAEVERLLIIADLGNGGTARIIDPAEAATAPFSPRTNRNIALGAVLGLMLGAGAALLRETLDTSIKSRAVIEALTPGVAALASIPAMKSANPADGVVSLERPDGLETEAFRTLRASIQFASIDRPMQIIQVTSAGVSAGKTTVAANLAVVMAQAGKRVAIVDCDLRRPRIHSVFDCPQVPGVSSVIIGLASGEDASHEIAMKNGRLQVFPSGPIPPGPSELLGSKRAQATLQRLCETVDVVILDSPPVLPVADALVLSRLVDATVVVANASRTKRDDLLRAMAQLEQAGAPVIGTVLNAVKAKANHGYGYGYGYGYGEGSTIDRFFGRSSARAPRPKDAAVLHTADLPRFEAARTDPEPAAAQTQTTDPGSGKSGAPATGPAVEAGRSVQVDSPDERDEPLPLFGKPPLLDQASDSAHIKTERKPGAGSVTKTTSTFTSETSSTRSPKEQTKRAEPADATRAKQRRDRSKEPATAVGRSNHQGDKPKSTKKSKAAKSTSTNKSTRSSKAKKTTSDRASAKDKPASADGVDPSLQTEINKLRQELADPADLGFDGNADEIDIR